VATAGALPVAVPPGPAPPGPDELPGPPPPETLSYSALSAWRRCGYRFYLQRILRLPEERVPPEQRRRDASGALDLRLRGTMVHELLEHGAGEEGLGERVAAVAERHGVELADEEVDDLAALVRAGIRSPLAARLAAARAVRREHAFTFGLGPATVNGIVDVLADEADGALVVDWKTDRVPHDADADAYLEDRYGVQRRIYALAVLRSGAPRVEVAYALLDRGADAVHATVHAPEDVPALEAELLALAEGPLTGDFRVAEAPHRDLCLTCPGRRALCSWDESMTLRDDASAVATMGPDR
jgi:RecB family exonuclease